MTKVWTGIIEWKRHNRTNVLLLSCDILTACSGLTDLKRNAWPDSLQLHLIPKDTLTSVGQEVLLKGMKTVIFKMKPSLELIELTKALRHGMVASVKFPPTPGCDIKVIILLYDHHMNKYLGIVPNQQNEFISKLHHLIQGKIEQIAKSKVIVKSSNPNPDIPARLAKAWRGVVQWKRPGKNVSPLNCTILATKNTLPDLKMDTWPKTIKLHLMPEKAASYIIDGGILKDRQTVLFKITPSIELIELTHEMQRGIVGYVKFDPSPGCHIQTMLLLYSLQKKQFLGLIPKDQNKYVNKLHQLVKTCNQFKVVLRK